MNCIRKRACPHNNSIVFYFDIILYLLAPWILLGLLLAWLRWGPQRLKERLLPGPAR